LKNLLFASSTAAPARVDVVVFIVSMIYLASDPFALLMPVWSSRTLIDEFVGTV
jgi:hypothetical protein